MSEMRGVMKVERKSFAPNIYWVRVDLRLYLGVFPRRNQKLRINRQRRRLRHFEDEVAVMMCAVEALTRFPMHWKPGVYSHSWWELELQTYSLDPQKATEAGNLVRSIFSESISEGILCKVDVFLPR